MLDKFYKQFKSGTDIRGVASEGVEGQPVNLTDDVVARMADGFVLWLSKKVSKAPETLTISIGRDSRISGPHIVSICSERFKRCGATVLDCSLASTPSMFMTTVDLGCDGALQITASHHPFNRNGLKFFTREGGLEGSDIEEILEYAQNGESPAENSCGKIRKVDYMTDYAKGLCKKIKEEVNAEDYDHPLKGFKIVVDAGNGAGGFYADKVLSVLGADTTGSRYLDPDGMFPNHIPNPEDATAMASICEAVKEANADLGVIFDTDVDRGGAVDSKGNEINRNRLVAVAAAIALEGNEGGTVVTDSITSSGLKEFIEDTLGGQHYRYRRGYKNVIDKALELNAQGINCPLAIETSGHAAMKENYFLDDGAYLCTKIIIKAAQMRKEGKELDELTAALKEPVESKEVRFKILESDFRACGEKIINDLTAYAMAQNGWNVANDNREGIRVSFDKDNGDGWFLLRLSVHDPIMPLNIESDSVGGVDIIYNKLNEFLKTTSGLEL
ncbi:phosphomannomutase/phosphoglucomutase [uncultured Ruminococcus sp.]|uniref:phosphomannomutase/phosphoglucomutase n=1 Tax=uncultured Ruminococcus sp. TaxID=165186 RepID=UPI0025D86161|nr:phosphomannomutase/phosphoglucomutase [uncultured Ruminococcus sp.]